MTKYALLILTALLTIVPASMAIDRDAKMIDTAALELMELDDADGIGLAVWGETAFNPEITDWSILVKAGYGEFSPTGVDDFTYWTASVGLKHYLTTETSIALIGNFTHYSSDRDAKSAIVAGKHRFVPAGENVSPYVTASAGIRDRSSFSDDDQTNDSFGEAVFSAGGGVEFRMTDTLSLIFDLKLVQADESDDSTEDLDGLVGFLGLQYYFLNEE